MAKAKKQSNKGAAKLDMRITLIMYALIPLIVSSVILSIILINKSGSEMKIWNNNSLLQVVKQTGAAFDTVTVNNERILQSYASAPIVKDFLLNPVK